MCSEMRMLGQMACMNRQPESQVFFIRDTSHLTTCPQCYFFQARQIQETPTLMLHRPCYARALWAQLIRGIMGTMFFLVYFSTWAEAWLSEVRKEVIITASQHQGL